MTETNGQPNPQRNGDRFTTRKLFQELEGREFETYGDLEVAVKELFSEHADDFPAGYTYRDAIRWASRQGWLVVEGEQHLRVPEAA